MNRPRQSASSRSARSSAYEPPTARNTAGQRDVNPAQPLVRQGLDYRVLQPALLMNPNRNRSEVLFDALGMVVATAIMGKPEDIPRLGDLLDNQEPDLTDSVVSSHL